MDSKILALHLLRKRKHQHSILDGFMSMKFRMILRLFFLLFCYLMYSIGQPHLLVGVMAGFVLGMFIQDFSWLLGGKKSWKGLSEFIDWQKVESKVNSDSQQV